MSVTHPPLEHHPRFIAQSRETLCEAVESALRARCIRLPGQDGFRAVANSCALPSGELWFCSYGAPVTLRIPEGDYIRVQFQNSGAGATRSAGGSVEVTETQACVSSGAVLIEFPEGFQQIVWRCERATLLAKLDALIGRRVADLDLEGPVPLDLPEGRTLCRILGSLLTAVDHTPSALNRTLITELEQALVVSFLGAAPEAARLILSAPEHDCSALHVRRVEELIEANWDGALRMEQIAALTGQSARTIYRAFRRERGYSPMQFLRRLRLRQGRRMLEDPANTLNVAEIAVACGFVDASHFGRAFTSEFGISPSAARPGTARRTR